MEKEVMRTNDMKFETSEKIVLGVAWGFVSSVLLLLLVGLLLLVMGFAGASFAQESPQPRTFSSPGEASDALFQAAQKEDEPALEAILGAGKEVTSSRDDVDDKLERERFSQKYQEMQPSGPRARWQHGAVHRRGKLAISDPSDLKERLVVFRFRDRHTGNFVPKNWRE
jgi:uncharacterized iron-regulated membrane protein